MKRIIILSIATIFILSLFMTNAFARSEVVKVDDCTFKVYIFIALEGTNDTAMMSLWETGIESMWNGPSGSQTFGECKCKVTFDAVMKNVSNCTGVWGTGWHCYGVTRNATNKRGNKADSTVTKPNTTDAWGDWSVSTSAMDAAHEIGHAMGLGDEYNYTNGAYTVSGNDSMSIMARTWPDAAGALPHANQWHINEIMAGVTCPDKCCCGNGQKDAGKEQCEKSLTPSGCGEGETCTADCKCIGNLTTPSCGDGKLYRPPNYGQPGVGGEECDWNMTPTGCPPEKPFCNKQCKCEGCNSTITIDDPSNNSIITESIIVNTTIEFMSDFPEVVFYLDNQRMKTDRSEPYDYLIDFTTMAAGSHMIEARLYDDECYTEDSITIIIEGLPDDELKCGNGICDETEYCYTCPDCACGAGEICDPSYPGIGCGLP